MEVSGRATPRPGFPPGEMTPPPVPIVQEAGWAPAGLDTEARGKILSPLPWIEPRLSSRPARNQTLC
jgi:hypothetical protein